MKKTIGAFIFGLVIGGASGAIGGYLYWKKKQSDFEKKHEERVNKEIKDLREARRACLEERNEKETNKEVKEDVTGGIKKALVKDRKKRVAYHDIKPPLDSLVRKTFGSEDLALQEGGADAGIDIDRIRSESIQRQLEQADSEGKRRIRVTVPGPGSEEVIKALHPYQIVSFDDDDIPLGYGNECLDYYRGNDILIGDQENVIEDIPYILGGEAYDLVRDNPGEICLINHRNGMVYDVRSLDTEYVFDVFAENGIDDDISNSLPGNGKYKAIIEEDQRFERHVRKSKPKEDDI